MLRETDFKQTLCADNNGFSLHAAVRCPADDRQALCLRLPRGGAARGAWSAMAPDRRRRQGGARVQRALMLTLRSGTERREASAQSMSTLR